MTSLLKFAAKSIELGWVWLKVQEDCSFDVKFDLIRSDRRELSVSSSERILCFDDDLWDAI